MKLSAKRRSIKIDFEFKNGETVELEYHEPSTKQINDSLEEKAEQPTLKAVLDGKIKTLKENLTGSKAKEAIAEIQKIGNVYNIIEQLDAGLMEHFAKK